MPAHFTPAAPRFLKALARHNDRAWFEPRKPTYESELKAPMLAVIAELNEAMLAYAPGHVRPPHKIMMRLYRDTRFSPDKRPYKRNLAAWWALQGLEKTSGGGFYLQIGPDGVVVAGGAYMPERDQLRLIREMLLTRHEEYRRIVSAPRLLKAMQPLDPLRMARGPKGFPLMEDGVPHPATDLILQRQWGVSAQLPMETALQPDFVKVVTGYFKLAAPLVALLNQPLLTTKPPKPMF